MIEQSDFRNRFAHHLVLMFVVYDIIYRRKVVLAYSLLVKLGMGKKTKELIRKITYAQLTATATKIKKRN